MKTPWHIPAPLLLTAAPRKNGPGAATMMMLVMMLAVAGGCAEQRIETPQARELAELRYPETARSGPTLDVLVHTEGREIHLVNRTPRTYHGMQLWLNRQYVRHIRKLDIGEGNYYELRSFVNRWQEPFPTGGLLTPERRRPMVLAELYDPDADVRYPLQTQPQ